MASPDAVQVGFSSSNDDVNPPLGGGNRRSVTIDIVKDGERISVNCLDMAGVPACAPLHFGEASTIKDLRDYVRKELSHSSGGVRILHDSDAVPDGNLIATFDGLVATVDVAPAQASEAAIETTREPEKRCLRAPYISVGCVTQDVDGVAGLGPCCAMGLCCGPPYFSMCGGVNPADEVFQSQGNSASWAAVRLPALGDCFTPSLAYLLCLPVCSAVYIPAALLGCCFPSKVNVGPCCYCGGQYASLGTSHDFCGDACDNLRDGGGNWCGYDSGFGSF
eukprot:TRINITY_DN4808_c0_g1_i1.p1 TRINITY_DN4808_c0_g1~~TRINITY_DN4808_c0_g1_i1.p1  ORF type:complete len:298 (+),score=23.65 TRINITY_DN4808_c0_g1_i1:63-896(+)